MDVADRDGQKVATGTIDELANLLGVCHARGIRVEIDRAILVPCDAPELGLDRDAGSSELADGSDEGCVVLGRKLGTVGEDGVNARAEGGRNEVRVGGVVELT